VAELAGAKDSGKEKWRFFAFLGITRNIDQTIDFTGDDGDSCETLNAIKGPRKRGEN